MRKDEIINIIKNYPNEVEINDESLKNNYSMYECYNLERDESLNVLREIGIENILKDENCINAIINKFGKQTFYTFIQEYNGYRHSAIQENDNEKLVNLRAVNNPRFAERVSARAEREEDFISYAIAFIEDPEVVDKVIEAAASKQNRNDAIYRGVNGLQQSMSALTRDNYKDMLPLWENGLVDFKDLEPMVELGFYQNVMNSVTSYVKDTKTVIDCVNDLNSRMGIVRKNQQELTLAKLKKQITNVNVPNDLTQEVENINKTF